MSKREEIREKRRKQKEERKMMTLGAIIIGAGLIVAALIYPSLAKSGQVASRYMADNNAMGDPNAPVKIVEYSSYKCGHCAAFSFETEPILEEEYIKTGKVYFTYKAIWEELSAEASYCAGEQNKYWEMHDVIFANQAAAFNENAMASWAKSVEVDMTQFDNCMAEDTYVDLVKQDNTDAQAVGVEGTPTFIISYLVDGEVVEQMMPGNYPIESFRQAIAEGLAATEN